MLKNYLTIAISNLLKNKLYSAINIVGLAIGLAACIVISLYVRDQYSYDKQWRNSDRIYRVNVFSDLPGRGPRKTAWAPLPAMPLLHEFFKDKIEKSARMLPNGMIIDTGETKFEDTLVEVDPEFIELFQFEVLAGSLEETLSAPSKIALSEEVAMRHFGNRNPIGKLITLSFDTLKFDYEITAVYRIPGNTVIDAPLLSLFDGDSAPEILKSWYVYSTRSFFQLKEGVDIEALKPLLPTFINQKVDFSRIHTNPDIPVSDVLSLDFQNIETAYIDSPWDDSRASGNKTIVASFAAISLLVLIIGCVNFTILTTAKATQRAREVAMRKVVGAKRNQLILQFLGESTFIALLAMLLSLGVVEFMLPIFVSIIGKSLLFSYTDPSVFLPLLALLCIVGISGGLYPAVILSGFRPGNTLKANQSRETGSSMTFRSALVVFQFSVSIILMIATGVIHTQMQYTIKRDPGYNKDNLLVINEIGFGGIFKHKIKALKQELLNQPNVTDVGLSDIQPSEQHTQNYMFTHLGRPENIHLIARNGVDYDYFSTYQIPIVAGRKYYDGRDIPEPEVDFMTISLGDNKSKAGYARNPG